MATGYAREHYEAGTFLTAAAAIAIPALGLAVGALTSAAQAASWASRSPGMASASGVQEENDCVPDCAAALCAASLLA
jgi:hypothetical protein